MEIGDLVKFMSRTLLVIDIDDVWAYGMETGSKDVGKYRKSVVTTVDPIEEIGKFTSENR